MEHGSEAFQVALVHLSIVTGTAACVWFLAVLFNIH